MQVDSMKLVEDIFLDKISRVNDTLDYFAVFENYDLNADGRDELIMIVNAGYSEQPRRIYAWDFSSGVLYKSPVVGFKHSYIEFFDIDNDGFPEIIPCTVSYENIEKSQGIPFNDYERWFVVYDHELNFKSAPINLGHGAGSVGVYNLKQDGQHKLLIRDRANEHADSISYYHFDLHTGKLIPTGDIFNLGTLSFQKLKIDNRLYFLSYESNSGRIAIRDPADLSINIREKYIVPGMSYCKPVRLKAYNDLLVVFLDIQAENNILRFYSANNFEEVANFSFSPNREFHHLSVYQDPHGKELIAIQVGEYIASLEFKSDPYYFIKLTAIYIFIYTIYVLLIWLILRLQDQILKKNYQREQLIAELKLKTIRNQLDPHFTFNAINAIASAIFKEEKEKAYSYFSLFSKLLRATTLYSDRMTRMLKDEIEYTMQYLDIELFRFREKFEYNIDVGDEVNVSQHVPRMIIQTFAESAVTNGLMHRKDNGKLNITIRQSDKFLEIIFDDNGVGVEESKRLNKQKAFKSIKIFDEFIRIFNDLNNTTIKYEMKDISTDIKYPGTRVIVVLPANYRYKGITDD
jgi:hypothetical protein